MANLQNLYNNIKRNPDNQFFKDLMTLLNFRLDTVKDQWIVSTDDRESTKLQGRAAELKDIISALSRKPVNDSEQHTGSFD